LVQKFTIKTVRVSEKGQIAIPSDIRREMRIKKGDDLLLVTRGDKILLKKASKVSARFAGEFNFMLKHAERVAEKLWENKEDEVWDTL